MMKKIILIIGAIFILTGCASIRSSWDKLKENVSQLFGAATQKVEQIQGNVMREADRVRGQADTTKKNIEELTQKVKATQERIKGSIDQTREAARKVEEAAKQVKEAADSIGKITGGTEKPASQ